MTLRTAILTISDRSSRGEREDISGPALAVEIQKLGWELVKTGLVPDDMEEIKSVLIQWASTRQMDLILTTGGTGFSPRDVTPEATLAVIERSTPGLAEAMRSESLKVTPHAMLSRAVAGIRNRTLIVNFPGSPHAAVENLAVIAPVLPHAVELLHESSAAEKGHTFQP
jgi:molybdenum cofactor synthesis domain-containing protein